MTVVKTHRVERSVSVEVMYLAVQNTLAQDPPRYRYKDTIADSSEMLIRTRIRPRGFLMLSSTLEVKIEAKGGGSVVTATMRTPKWIMGDIFGYLDRYLGRFSDSLLDNLREYE